MTLSIILKNRRFTCLSPTLVRMEFAPDGRFEDRQSLVAHSKQKPVSFTNVRTEGHSTLLETGVMTLVSSQDDRAFFPANLDVRWIQDGFLQYWKPGDCDHDNLGGTVRSLDSFSHELKLDGVHPAGLDSPDAYTSNWLTWHRDEEAPWYYQHSPTPQPGPGFQVHASVKNRLGLTLIRTNNMMKSHLRYCPGVLSRSGYFLLNDSLSPVLDADGFPVERNRPGYQDWYMFVYVHDYRQALRDFIMLTGRPSLPTLASFGLMFSRWPAFGADEARQIVDEFEKREVPLSTLVVDMEWHKEGWGGWEWDPAMFPDPRGFFDWAHGKGLQVTLNDHPNDLRSDNAQFEAFVERTQTRERVRHTTYSGKDVDMVDVNLCDKKEATVFLELCHKPVIDQGLDFWWNDGNRGTLNGSTSQLVCNKLSFEEMKSDERRGMLLARYGGVGSHRYGVFFTGDTLSCWQVLQEECEFNIRAGHIGLAHISHDIGGFSMQTRAALLDPELFLRWVQFGVFNPIIRFHSAPGFGSRKPWDYGPEIEQNLLRWLKVRNSFIPYIYTAAREHFETGFPIVRGLFLDEPHSDRAYRFDEFYFGPSLLVAPVLSPDPYRPVFLPEGTWYRFETNECLAGGRDIVPRLDFGDMPVYVKAGSILVRQVPGGAPAQPHVENLHLDVYPGVNGLAQLYEDDGRSQDFEKGVYCKTEFLMKTTESGIVLSSRVIEGKPFMPTRRVTVDISLERRPNLIRLNRDKTMLAEELGAPGRYRVSLGQLDAAASFLLELTI